ncbi:MAG: PEP-CTERM sorting domain-containing protein [Oscillatoriaceae cyanobacterium Prado104]|jgi:probable HAF family extracellular repeat protein|nr:PEP-CTERM sorting domain-containing protein [Oscillatoriaceae cyanobacterium Prado104]
MPKFKKMSEQARSIEFVRSCLSLTAFALWGFSTVGPVNATNIHTGFASYTITDLGRSNTYSINNLGQVAIGKDGVGWIWENGNLTEVTGSTWANQINISGQVVGRYLSENSTDNAYLWENGQRTDLGNFGGISSVANDINDSGQIVGKFAISEQQWFPFLWQNGEMSNLGTLGYDAGAARAINNQGQIVGHSDLAFGITHAFLWENGTMKDLGTLDGHNNSIAYDINDLGVAIGYSANRNTQQSKPVIWSNGQITELGTLGGNVNFAVSINNKGQAVGYGNTAASDISHGIIWEDGQTANINSLIPADSGWFLQQINGINDRGQIVGQGINKATGQNHGFLLNPICGSSQRNPLLPDNFEDGWHSFNNVANRLWFDPPTSAGFTFKIGEDAVSSDGGGRGDGCIVESSPIAVNPDPTQPSLFTKILGLPSGIDADELFSVVVGGQEIGNFRPNEVVDFVALLGYGVSEFSVTGIDALIDPTNPRAFPIKLESNRDKFSFKMRAIDSAEAVPEPSEVAGIVTAAAVFVWLFFKRKSQRQLELGETRDR